MSTILPNKPTPSIFNAIEYYRKEYINSPAKTLYHNQNAYISEKLIHEDRVLDFGKRRKRPGRPPSWWYDSMHPDDIDSFIFDSTQDRIAFMLKWSE